MPSISIHETRLGARVITVSVTVHRSRPRVAAQLVLAIIGDCKRLRQALA